MKKISNILARMEASLNGSLDGLELDNTDDVIEKSTVIEMVKDLKMLVNEAQQQVKNLNIPAVMQRSEQVCIPECDAEKCNLVCTVCGKIVIRGGKTQTCA